MSRGCRHPSAMVQEHFNRPTTAGSLVPYFASLVGPFTDLREQMRPTIAELEVDIVYANFEEPKLELIKQRVTKLLEEHLPGLAERYLDNATRIRVAAMNTSAFLDQKRYYELARSAFDEGRWEDCIHLSRYVHAVCCEAVNALRPVREVVQPLSQPIVEIVRDEPAPECRYRKKKRGLASGRRARNSDCEY